MAGATWNCCHLSASSVYIIQPCISLRSHFIQSHICGVHVCLAVTGRLHFWQNNQDLLHATVATQGRNGHRNKSQQRRIFSCCSWWDLNPGPFNHESIALPLSHPRSPCLNKVTAPFPLSNDLPFVLDNVCVFVWILHYKSALCYCCYVPGHQVLLHSDHHLWRQLCATVMAFPCVFGVLYKIAILVIFGSTLSVNSFILVVNLREVG